MDFVLVPVPDPITHAVGGRFWLSTVSLDLGLNTF